MSDKINDNMRIYEPRIEGVIEAVLFAAGEPVEMFQLTVAAQCSADEITSAISSMNERYLKEKRGIYVTQIEGCYQMSTNRIYAEDIRRCLNIEKPRPLSQTLLETLAIIAYAQPVTKQQIADIRGADAKHAVNKLMEKGLVQEMGRQDAPGKPLLFGTTDEFLRKFGFSSIEEVPNMLGKLETENAKEAEAFE